MPTSPHTFFNNLTFSPLTFFGFASFKLSGLPDIKKGFLCPLKIWYKRWQISLISEPTSRSHAGPFAENTPKRVLLKMLEALLVKKVSVIRRLHSGYCPSAVTQHVNKTFFMWRKVFELFSDLHRWKTWEGSFLQLLEHWFGHQFAPSLFWPTGQIWWWIKFARK